METQATSLDQLATLDPSVAPLARLQSIALATASEPGWSEGVPPLRMVSASAPLLDGQTLVVDATRQRALLVALAQALDPSARDGPALAGHLQRRTLDPLALLAAGVAVDTAALEALADSAEVDVMALTVISQVASLPLLLACGAAAESALQELEWQHGYCPTCGAFPALAELRGLARDRVLRCGRCATGWPIEHDRCPFCETRDQQAAGYFAAEAERESRRAVTCEACHGYLKTVTTLGPLTPVQLLLRDLETLELDITALDHDYSRPDRLGWPLTVRLQAAPERRTGWNLGAALRWRR